MTGRGSPILTLMAVLFMHAAPAHPGTPEPAFVKIVTVTPASSSTVNSQTVIEATLQYHIQPFDRTARYMMVPMFEAVDHSPFNDLMDGLSLRKPSGTVNVKYPIRRQVADPKLGRPMKFSFALVESKPGGFVRIVIMSDEVIYEVK